MVILLSVVFVIVERMAKLMSTQSDLWNSLIVFFHSSLVLGTVACEMKMKSLTSSVPKSFVYAGVPSLMSHGCKSGTRRICLVVS